MKVNKEKLKKVLEIVKPGLANKEVIEQTTSFAFVEGKVVTYNDEICISSPIPELPFTGAVKAEELYKFIGKLREDEIDVTVTENEVLMKSGRASAGFAITAEITLPLEEEISFAGEWRKLPKNFLQACSFALPCTSQDMSNPKLTCVHLNKKGIVEATDNYRVVRWELERKLPFETTLLPSTSLREVLKITPKLVNEGSGWLHFKNEDDTVVSCRTFNETFVKTDAVLALVKDGTPFTFPEGTLEVLDRATIFTKAQSKITNQEIVEVVVTKKQVMVQCQTETSWFKEGIPLKGYKDDDFTFLVTPYLLQDILKETATCTITNNMLKFSGEQWTYISSLVTK